MQSLAASSADDRSLMKRARQTRRLRRVEKSLNSDQQASQRARESITFPAKFKLSGGAESISTQRASGNRARPFSSNCCLQRVRVSRQGEEEEVAGPNESK